MFEPITKHSHRIFHLINLALAAPLAYTWIKNRLGVVKKTDETIQPIFDSIDGSSPEKKIDPNSVGLIESGWKAAFGAQAAFKAIFGQVASGTKILIGLLGAGGLGFLASQCWRKGTSGGNVNNNNNQIHIHLNFNGRTSSDPIHVAQDGHTVAISLGPQKPLPKTTSETVAS